MHWWATFRDTWRSTKGRRCSHLHWIFRKSYFTNFMAMKIRSIYFKISIKNWLHDFSNTFALLLSFNCVTCSNMKLTFPISSLLQLCTFTPGWSPPMNCSQFGNLIWWRSNEDRLRLWSRQHYKYKYSCQRQIFQSRDLCLFVSDSFIMWMNLKQLHIYKCLFTFYQDFKEI